MNKPVSHELITYDEHAVFELAAHDVWGHLTVIAGGLEYSASNVICPSAPNLTCSPGGSSSINVSCTRDWACATDAACAPNRTCVNPGNSVCPTNPSNYGCGLENVACSP
jgi:hypothetical protein